MYREEKKERKEEKKEVKFVEQEPLQQEEVKIEAAPQLEIEEELTEAQQEVVDMVERLFAEKYCYLFDPDLYDELEETEKLNSAANMKDEVSEMLDMFSQMLTGRKT